MPNIQIPKHLHRLRTMRWNKPRHLKWNFFFAVSWVVVFYRHSFSNSLFSSGQWRRNRELRLWMWRCARKVVVFSLRLVDVEKVLLLVSSQKSSGRGGDSSNVCLFCNRNFKRVFLKLFGWRSTADPAPVLQKCRKSKTKYLTIIKVNFEPINRNMKPLCSLVANSIVARICRS